MKKQVLVIKFPVKYSELGTYIFDDEDKMVADVRGWGWIQKLPQAEQTQDSIGEFIAEAMNEKYDRDTNE